MNIALYDSMMQFWSWNGTRTLGKINETQDWRSNMLIVIIGDSKICKVSWETNFDISWKIISEEGSQAGTL